MENLSPALVLIWYVRRAVEGGRSVASGIEGFIKINDRDVFASQVRIWWAAQKNPEIAFDKSRIPLRRRYLLALLESGLQGNSILDSLISLENELILSCESELQEYVSRLPLLALGPLMFFIFPAIMLLLIFPLLGILQI